MISVHWETNTKKKIPTRAVGQKKTNNKDEDNGKNGLTIFHLLHFFNKFSQFFSNLKKILGCRIWSFWLNVCFSSRKQPPIKQVSFSISRYFAFATRSIWDEMKKRSGAWKLVPMQRMIYSTSNQNISIFFEKHKTFANWSPSCWKRMGRGCMATNVETFDIRFHPRNTINAQFLIELAIAAWARGLCFILNDTL